MLVNNESKPSDPPPPPPPQNYNSPTTSHPPLKGGGGGSEFYTNNRFMRSSPVFNNVLNTLVPDCSYDNATKMFSSCMLSEDNLRRFSN